MKLIDFWGVSNEAVEDVDVRVVDGEKKSSTGN